MNHTTQDTTQDTTLGCLGCHWLCQCRTTDGTPYRSRSRRGISLMEVMLATVIMLAAVMALSRVAFVARRHAADAEDRSMAQMLCQNILHELLAGARPLQDVSPEPIEGDRWVYMIRIESVEGVGTVEGPPLSKVTVQVDRLEDDHGETAHLPTEEEMNGYQLVHWMRTGSPPASVPEGGGL